MLQGHASSQRQGLIIRVVESIVIGTVIPKPAERIGARMAIGVEIGLIADLNRQEGAGEGVPIPTVARPSGFQICVGRDSVDASPNIGLRRRLDGRAGAPGPEWPPISVAIGRPAPGR